MIRYLGYRRFNEATKGETVIKELGKAKALLKELSGAVKATNTIRALDKLEKLAMKATNKNDLKDVQLEIESVLNDKYEELSDILNDIRSAQQALRKSSAWKEFNLD